MNYAYSYDKMDNIKTKNTEQGNYNYNYDNLYRLNEVKKDTTQTEVYTYDEVGNRITAKDTTGNWSYDNNNELISTPPSSSGSTGGSSYVYDANGNTIQRNNNGQITNFVYNAENRLIQVKDGSGSVIATYTYDPFGRRIKKTVSPAGGGGGDVTTYYLYSDEGLIGEYDSTGAEIKTYGYKPNSTWSTDPVFCHSREGGNPEYYFYHNDHLGTPQKMTDISGAIVWSATYDAFGKATVDGSSSVTNNLRFPGQYFDSETGLHYNWFRYYEAESGRYVTVDPIGFWGGDENLYRYVNANPIKKADALGLKACPPKDCFKVFWDCLADTMIGPGWSTFTMAGGEAAGYYYTASAFGHAASRNLIYPMRSSIFRSLLGIGSKLPGVGTLGTLIIAEGICLAKEIECVNEQ